jgi:hypothetical protein
MRGHMPSFPLPASTVRPMKDAVEQEVVEAAMNGLSRGKDGDLDTFHDIPSNPPRLRTTCKLNRKRLPD